MAWWIRYWRRRNSLCGFAALPLVSLGLRPLYEGRTYGDPKRGSRFLSYILWKYG